MQRQNNPDPPAWHRRLLLQFAIGGSLLVLLNLVRLVSLYWVGITFPGQFALAHDVLWPLVIIAALLFLWWQAVGRDSRSSRRRVPAVASSGAA